MSGDDVGGGEIAQWERSIESRDEVRGVIFSGIPKTTLEQSDAEGSEISLVDKHHSGLRLLPIAISVDLEGALIARMGRHCIAAHSGSGDAGDGCDLLPDLLYVRSACFARLNTAPLVPVLHVHHDPELHDICGSIAKRYLRELKKTPHRSARGSHEKKRERDLGGDENAPAD